PLTTLLPYTTLFRSVCNELGIANEPLTEEEWVRTSRTGNTVNWKKNTQGEGTVPDVSGMTFRDAIYLLEQSGLKVIYEGKGRVIDRKSTRLNSSHVK